MKQYVIAAAALASALLLATACSDNTQPRHVAVTGPHGTPAHEIPTIDTDRGDASDQSHVNYVTGGIGDDERAAIEAEKGNYNVHITSSSTNGAFVEDTGLVITSKAGVQLLSITAGPLTYVQLPAGAYSVTATHGDQQKTSKLLVGKGKTSRVHFGWTVPAETTD